MRQWTVAPAGGAECGYCSRRIAEHTPVQVITFPNGRRSLYRCVDHADGPVDQVAIDLERFRLEREGIQHEQAAVPDRPPSVHRVNPRPRRMTSTAELTSTMFDHKSAAAGERE